MIVLELRDYVANFWMGRLLPIVGMCGLVSKREEKNVRLSLLKNQLMVVIVGS